MPQNFCLSLKVEVGGFLGHAYPEGVQRNREFWNGMVSQYHCEFILGGPGILYASSSTCNLPTRTKYPSQIRRTYPILGRHPCFMPYVNLSQRAYYSFLSFIFSFGKESLSLFLLLFSSIRERGSLLFFLLFLFVLQARIYLYLLERFLITDFCGPMLLHVLYKIYTYVILKHVVCR